MVFFKAHVCGVGVAVAVGELELPDEQPLNASAIEKIRALMLSMRRLCFTDLFSFEFDYEDPESCHLFARLIDFLLFVGRCCCQDRRKTSSHQRSLKFQ